MEDTPRQRPTFTFGKTDKGNQTTARKQYTPKLRLTARKERLETEVAKLRLSEKYMEDDELGPQELIPMCYSVLSWNSEIALTQEFAKRFNTQNESIRQLFVKPFAMQTENATMTISKSISVNFVEGLRSLAGWAFGIEFKKEAEIFSVATELQEIVVSRAGVLHTPGGMTPITAVFRVDFVRGAIDRLQVVLLQRQVPTHGF